MTQLNALIFNEIVEPLIYKKTFKECLEISLISKSAFKIVQNLITFQSKRLKITLGSIPTLKEYIIGNGDSDSNNLNLKLIQFQAIQYIQCRLQKDQLFKREEINDFSDHGNVKSLLIEAKEFLNKYCPNLKRVSLIKHVYSQLFGSPFFDYTMNGFFKFQGLCIDIDDDGLPYSNDEEFKEIHILENDSDDEDESDQAFKNTSLNYQFSFNFISNYLPKKVTVSYADENSGAYGICIYGFNNLVNHKCIKSLEFEKQPTRPEFIKKILCSKYIKSLSLNYCPDEIDYNKISNDDDYDSSATDNTDYSSDLIDSITQGLTNNTTLVKLSFNNWHLHKIKYNNPLGLFELLDKISATTKLTSLDLYGFNIKDSNILLPLIKLPFISTCYYHFDELNEQYYFESFQSYLNHFNENPNIKSFKFTYIYRNEFLKSNRDLVDIFSSFFSSNKSSLEQLSIKFNFDRYDFNLPKVNEIKQNIINSLQSSTSSKKLKLTWKYDNLTRKYN